MAAKDRFGGPVLANLKSASLFWADSERERMATIRLVIEKVRSAWHDHAEYAKLKERIRSFIRPEQKPPEFRERIESLLSGYTDWADINYGRPEEPAIEKYAATELYASKDGYDYLFRITNHALRDPDIGSDLLETVVALVELLTIELYNLRLSNIGDPMYSNYQGITYRGIQVTSELAQAYRDVANYKDVSQRHFAVPLGFMSSTTEAKTMEEFASQNSLLEPMHWNIHIHSLNPQLLHRYQQRYPTSVVTSICAMPIGHISPFTEKEILLRGPLFHIIRMDTVKEGGRNVHKLEIVMLNSNRDHGSELASDRGEKGVQRQFFLNLILASRYEICAMLSKNYSIADSKEYTRLAQAARQKIDEVTTSDANYSYSSNPTQTLADSKPTWLGSSLSKSFPPHYANMRHRWQNAVRDGRWADVTRILHHEYNWCRTDWLHVAKLYDKEEEIQSDDGSTLLHEIARRGPPPEFEHEEKSAWDELLQILDRDGPWRTLRTFDYSAKTPREIAQEHGREGLARLFEPRFYHHLATSILGVIEAKLHTLMREHAGKYLDEHSFRMPQLSVLTELEIPELWIPIPYMYGGFLIGLEGQALHVTVFKTVFGATQPKQVKFHLNANMNL